jgi:hypothetical protein
MFQQISHYQNRLQMNLFKALIYNLKKNPPIL